jgi:hypothetical protein
VRTISFSIYGPELKNKQKWKTVAPEGSAEEKYFLFKIILE